MLLFFLIYIFSFNPLSPRSTENKKEFYDIINQDTINVKSFGAVGNGIKDDYAALKRVTRYVNERGYGIIYFPKGNYYIGRFNDSLNQGLDLKFSNCDGIRVIGKNAKITLNGNFNRAVSYTSRGYSYSNISQVVPFYFVNCKNISISGLEINGNITKMTRDKGVVEKGQGLITVLGCDNVRITNVSVHHSASDGIYIGATKKNSTNCTLLNVKSFNNARQGLSITGLRGATIKDCAFSNTGFTGKYGFHRPAAGVDIEPHQLLGGVKTGDILFEDCTWKNNIGGQLLCTGPALTSNITIRNCTFKGIDSFSRYQVILAADSVLVENCEMDLGRGILWPTWKATPGSHVVIRNCTIKSSLQGILSASAKKTDSVWIVNNNLIFTGDSLNSYFPYLQTKNLVFSNNKIFIPSSILRANKRPATSLIENAVESTGNLFYSESADVKPRVSYRNTRAVRDIKKKHRTGQIKRQFLP